MIGLDDLDARLLGALAADARKTNRALADSLRLSESACMTRLRRLESWGVVVGYTTLVRYDRLGAFLAWTAVTLISDDAAVNALFEAQISSRPEVISVWCVTGTAQFRLLTATRDFEAWRAFCAALRAQSEIVGAVSGSAVLKEYPPHADLAVKRFQLLRGE